MTRGVDIEQAAAEKEIRRRAKRHRGAGRRHPRAIRLIEMDAMSVDGALAQQAEAIVDVEIAAAPRKHVLDPCDFGAIFRHVRLQVDARMLIEQSPRQFELTLGRRRREARRHGVEKAIARMPLRDQLMRILVRRFGGVA